jgi:cellulose synthase operon protein YhjU
MTEETKRAGAKKKDRLAYGAGLWNLYFLATFALVLAGYATLKPLYVALLGLWVMVPVKNRILNALRQIPAVIAGAVLLYHESWLPSFDSVLENVHNLQAFSWDYLFDLARDFINPEMVLYGALGVLIYFCLFRWIRFTTITVLVFLGMICEPYVQTWGDYIAARYFNAASQNPTVVTAANPSAAAQAPLKADAPGKILESADVDAWLTKFFAAEKDRKARIPASLQASDTPFDIILLNICSLATDDLKAANLTDHPVLKNADLAFTNFNSATSYSGPATIRLLRSACGQLPHGELYEGRAPECEIMTRLDGLGYREFAFMDHDGKFDGYFESLGIRAGFNAPLAPYAAYPVAYKSFEGAPIYSDGAVFEDYLKRIGSSGAARSASFFNLIALHDGNRELRTNKSLAFGSRAEKLLNDIARFTDELAKSGRRVMLVIIPEHGAAVRGDKIQMPRLRDIPSPHITEVPVLVKFIGLQKPIASPVVYIEKTSHLALADLIGQVLAKNLFASADPEADLKAIAADLPRTERVSQNSNASVVEIGTQTFVKIKNGDWLPYRK